MTMTAVKPLPTLVNKLDDVHRIVEAVYANPEKAYTYDFETLDTRVKRLKRVGLGIGWGPEEDQASYIVTLHDSYPYLDWEKVLSVLQPMLEDDSLTQIAHNQLFDATILADDGVDLHLNTYDTMVMSWLLDTSTPNGLKKIVKSRYGKKMNEIVEFSKKETVSWSPNKIYALHKVDIRTLADYGAEDVRWTYRLWKDLKTELEVDPKIDKIYRELYRELLRILTYMQLDGVWVHREMLDDMAERCGAEMEDLLISLWETRPGEDFWYDDNEDEHDIDEQRKLIPELQKKWSDRGFLRPHLYQRPELAPKMFSPNSGPQLNQILFSGAELGLRPIGDKGDSGQYSVANDVLAKLQADDDSGFVATLMRYKTLGKLHGTYLLGLPPLIDADGRLRTSFRATLQTGRLSSSDPNLLNIVHSEDYPVRKAFMARPGHKLVVSDQSQLELRLVAHLGKDQGMIDDFRNGVDPHSSTTKAIFELDMPVEQIKDREPTKRKVGKTVNFAVLYGAGPRTIRDWVISATDGEIAPSLDEVRGWVDNFFAAKRGVKDYIRTQEMRAEQEGLVRTILGRPRHLPDAQGSNMKRKGSAMRQAVNTPVQGSGADVLDLVMRNMVRWLQERDWYRTRVWLLLQVHDELVFEAEDALAEEVAERLTYEMENVVKLLVPLHADTKIALDWYSGK